MLFVRNGIVNGCCRSTILYARMGEYFNPFHKGNYLEKEDLKAEAEYRGFGTREYGLAIARRVANDKCQHSKSDRHLWKKKKKMVHGFGKPYH